MDKSGEHLESMLAELNERVNSLEEAGGIELMEVLINRGTVLKMMDLTTSALDDFLTAAEIERTFSPERISADSHFKIHTGIASLIARQGGDPTEEYGIAAEYLDKVGDSEKFDRKSIVTICKEAVDNLPVNRNRRPFVMEALGLLKGNDPWTLKMRMIFYLEFPSYTD